MSASLVVSLYVVIGLLVWFGYVVAYYATRPVHPDADLDERMEYALNHSGLGLVLGLFWWPILMGVVAVYVLWVVARAGELVATPIRAWWDAHQTEVPHD